MDLFINNIMYNNLKRMDNPVTNPKYINDFSIYSSKHNKYVKCTSVKLCKIIQKLYNNELIYNLNIKKAMEEEIRKRIINDELNKNIQLYCLIPTHTYNNVFQSPCFKYDFLLTYNSKKMNLNKTNY